MSDTTTMLGLDGTFYKMRPSPIHDFSGPDAPLLPDYTVGDLVADIFACPSCGELRVDWIEIKGDDKITCLSCGREYCS